MDIARLEVVVVDFDGTREGAGLRVNEPACLPLSAPERVEVSVDAADVDLQIAVLVEAKARPGRSLTIVLRNVGVDSSLDSGS